MDDTARILERATKRYNDAMSKLNKATPENQKQVEQEVVNARQDLVHAQLHKQMEEGK